MDQKQEKPKRPKHPYMITRRLSSGDGECQVEYYNPETGELLEVWVDGVKREPPTLQP